MKNTHFTDDKDEKQKQKELNELPQVACSSLAGSEIKLPCPDLNSVRRWV